MTILLIFSILLCSFSNLPALSSYFQLFIMISILFNIPLILLTIDYLLLDFLNFPRGDRFYDTVIYYCELLCSRDFQFLNFSRDICICLYKENSIVVKGNIWVSIILNNLERLIPQLLAHIILHLKPQTDTCFSRSIRRVVLISVIERAAL